MKARYFLKSRKGEILPALAKRQWHPRDIVELHKSPRSPYAVALLLLGGQLMSMGFLAELFIAYQSPARKGYSISEETEDVEIKI